MAWTIQDRELITFEIILFVLDFFFFFFFFLPTWMIQNRELITSDINLSVLDFFFFFFLHGLTLARLVTDKCFY